MTVLIRDEQRTTVAGGVSNADATVVLPFKIDSVTGRVLVSAASSGITVLVATGTVDDSNLAFTFISQPTIIFVNGLGYIVSHGWSWNAGTLTATLDSPVGVGGYIYGI